MRIQIINGPNINLLGKREPEIYGEKLSRVISRKLRQAYPDVDIDYYQSNAEGELIDCIQQCAASRPTASCSMRVPIPIRPSHCRMLSVP
jgi:3-dehydroquinate dehydratase-2